MILVAYHYHIVLFFRKQNRDVFPPSQVRLYGMPEMDDGQDLRFFRPGPEDALSQFHIGVGLAAPVAQPAARRPARAGPGGGLPFGMAALMPNPPRPRAPRRPVEGDGDRGHGRDEDKDGHKDQKPPPGLDQRDGPQHPAFVKHVLTLGSL